MADETDIIDPGQTWAFTLTPGPTDRPGTLADRLAAAVAMAERGKMTVRRVTVELDATRAAPHEAAGVRNWLKTIGRRLGIKARWPEPAGAAP